MSERQAESSTTNERSQQTTDNSQRSERPELSGSNAGSEKASDKSSDRNAETESNGGAHQGERPELGTPQENTTTPDTEGDNSGSSTTTPDTPDDPGPSTTTPDTTQDDPGPSTTLEEKTGTDGTKNDEKHSGTPTERLSHANEKAKPADKKEQENVRNDLLGKPRVEKTPDGGTITRSENVSKDGRTKTEVATRRDAQGNVTDRTTREDRKNKDGSREQHYHYEHFGKVPVSVDATKTTSADGKREEIHSVEIRGNVTTSVDKATWTDSDGNKHTKTTTVETDASKGTKTTKESESTQYENNSADGKHKAGETTQSTNTKTEKISNK